MTPEVRLSPDGVTVAIRIRDCAIWPWKQFTCLMGDNPASDDHVRDWAPLLPASSEDGSA
jgi:hypothetical protein